MSSDILEKEIAIREHRLGSITGFKGTVKDLISESAGGCALKNSGRCFSQASSCACRAVCRVTLRKYMTQSLSTMRRLAALLTRLAETP